MRRNAEHVLQVHCVAWFRMQYPTLRRLLFAIPNGAKLSPASGPGINHLPEGIRRGMAWKKLEAEGAVKGAADLFLSVASGTSAGLYIEMKTPKGSQSEEQKYFEQAVLEQGYGYAMPRTFEEFQRVVKMYFETGEY